MLSGAHALPGAELMKGGARRGCSTVVICVEGERAPAETGLGQQAVALTREKRGRVGNGEVTAVATDPLCGRLPRALLFLAIRNLEQCCFDRQHHRVRRAGLRQRAGGEQRTGIGLRRVSHAVV